MLNVVARRPEHLKFFGFQKLPLVPQVTNMLYLEVSS
jgi:hypothetical protein